MKRRGLGKGLGMGYKNLAPMDSHIHRLSARGVKTQQSQWVAFKHKNKTLAKISIDGLMTDEIKETKKLLSQESNIPLKDIKVNLEAKGVKSRKKRWIVVISDKTGMEMLRKPMTKKEAEKFAKKQREQLKGTTIKTKVIELNAKKKVVGFKGDFDLTRTNEKTKIIGKNDRHIERSIYLDKEGQKYIKFDGKFWKYPQAKKLVKLNAKGKKKLTKVNEPTKGKMTLVPDTHVSNLLERRDKVIYEGTEYLISESLFITEKGAEVSYDVFRKFKKSTTPLIGGVINYMRGLDGMINEKSLTLPQAKKLVLRLESGGVPQ